MYCSNWDISYTLEEGTKILTYRINDWVVKYSGKECPDGSVYTTPKCGFICMPRNITERLAEKGYKFEDADAWLDLWCHTVYRDYEDCLKMLDTENTGDMVAMSYAFRPLTKNGYVSKNKHGVVTVLKKGRELFPDLEPLFSNATRGKAQQRVLQVSKVCMWMEMRDVPISGELMDTEEPYFIPSACWRNIGKGILSTTRFVGMLVAYDKRYAVYDIGDGTVDYNFYP